MVPVSESLRKDFEVWATSPPRNWSVDRHDERDTMWAGQYRAWNVQCAFEAFCARWEGEYALVPMNPPIWFEQLLYGLAAPNRWSNDTWLQRYQRVLKQWNDWMKVMP